MQKTDGSKIGFASDGVRPLKGTDPGECSNSRAAARFSAAEPFGTRANLAWNAILWRKPLISLDNPMVKNSSQPTLPWRLGATAAFRFNYPQGFPPILWIGVRALNAWRRREPRSFSQPVVRHSNAITSMPARPTMHHRAARGVSMTSLRKASPNRWRSIATAGGCDAKRGGADPRTRRATAMTPGAASIAALVLALALAACTPRIGVTITNAPSIPDCNPGATTVPCR